MIEPNIEDGLPYMWGALAFAVGCTLWHFPAQRYRSTRHILPLVGPPLAFFAGMEAARVERGGDVANAWRFVLAPACMVLAYVALVLAGCEFLRRRTAAAGVEWAEVDAV